MTALVAGIDVSSRRLDAAIIVLDADTAASFPVPCVFRSESLPPLQQVGHARHAKAVSAATRRLLADVGGTQWHWGEIVQAWVEEPWTSFGRGKATIATFGAILASIPRRVEACEVQPSEWRRELGIPTTRRATAKAASLEAAQAWLDAADEEWAWRRGPLTEDEAEALLVALAGRQLATRTAAA